MGGYASIDGAKSTQWSHLGTQLVMPALPTGGTMGATKLLSAVEITLLLLSTEILGT